MFCCPPPRGAPESGAATPAAASAAFYGIAASSARPPAAHLCHEARVARDQCGRWERFALMGSSAVPGSRCARRGYPGAAPACHQRGAEAPGQGPLYGCRAGRACLRGLGPDSRIARPAPLHGHPRAFEGLGPAVLPPGLPHVVARATPAAGDVTVSRAATRVEAEEGTIALSRSLRKHPARRRWSLRRRAERPETSAPFSPPANSGPRVPVPEEDALLMVGAGVPGSQAVDSPSVAAAFRGCATPLPPPASTTRWKPTGRGRGCPARLRQDRSR